MARRERVSAREMAFDVEPDQLTELETTAERVERFRLMHEDAVRDLREKIAEARAAGYEHDEIDHALRRARTSVSRFSRLPDAAA